MNIPAVQTRKFSYADYLTWDDDERCELINGAVHDMTPAPYTKHQRILLRLGIVIGNYLKGKKSELFIAPFDIRFPTGSDEFDKIYTVVQPDISVFSDRTKIDVRGGKYPPDWAVEILSRSTSKKDRTIKLELYQQHGVSEYW